MFVANIHLTTPNRDHFGIIEGPPLHDPLAVAAVLTGTPWEIEFYDYDHDASSNPAAPAVNKRERFDVKVITEGTHEGQTKCTLLPPGEEGVRIPKGLDIPKFWSSKW